MTIILIGTGSEVHLALEVQSALLGDGLRVRVVSMPSQELFEEQDSAYREHVLPSNVSKRVVLEAAIPFGWDRYLSTKGIMMGVGHFCKSAPYKVLPDKGLRFEGTVLLIRYSFFTYARLGTRAGMQEKGWQFIRLPAL